MDWIEVSYSLPPNEVVVETKIEDKYGCRNVQRLKLSSNLWFVPYGSIYVY